MEKKCDCCNGTGLCTTDFADDYSPCMNCNGTGHIGGSKKVYCKKEFLTESPEPSTATVVSFYGDYKWRGNEEPENLSFIEISSCHERARLHRTPEMSLQEWAKQVERLKRHIDCYLDFLTGMRESRKCPEQDRATPPQREQGAVESIHNQCSECGGEYDINRDHNYCPICGIKYGSPTQNE